MAVGVRARGKAVAAGADSAVAVAAGVDAAAVDGRAALPRSPVEGTADVGGALGGAMGGDREGLGMGGDREGLGGALGGGGPRSRPANPVAVAPSARHAAPMAATAVLKPSPSE